MISTAVKTLILAILFYFLLIFQMSYFPFFFSANAVIILVLLINLLEDHSSRFGIFCAVIAGLGIDIFSSWYIGTAALALFACSLLIKYILSRYVRIPPLPWLPKI